MIKEAYVSYEISLLLDEKGFKEETNWYYNSKGVCEPFSAWVEAKPYDYSPMPTHQMACAWLRQKGFEIGVFYLFKAINPDVTVFDGYIPNVTQIINGIYKDSWDLNTVKDYNDAVEAALKYTLENLMEEQQ